MTNLKIKFLIAKSKERYYVNKKRKAILYEYLSVENNYWREIRMKVLYNSRAICET